MIGLLIPSIVKNLPFKITSHVSITDFWSERTTKWYHCMCINHFSRKGSQHIYVDQNINFECYTKGISRRQNT